MPHSILGVGIIGVGRVRGWAATAHIPALRALPSGITLAVTKNRLTSDFKAAAQLSQLVTDALVKS
jgi:predicted dehydrogenase